MDFSLTQLKRVAKHSLALAMLFALVGCASSDDDAQPAAAREPPTAPSNPPASSSPTITGTPSTTAQAGTMYSFQPQVSDSDTSSSQLVFTITNCPTAWATCSTSTGRIQGTPNATQGGVYSNISISVRDPEGNVAVLPTFSITVNVPSQPPTFTNTPPTSVQVNSTYSFTPAVTDPDTPAASLRYSFSGFPTWLNTRNTTTGLISGTPVVGQEGTYNNMRITVTDGTNSRTLGPFSITVTALPTTNRPPAISGNPVTSILAGLLYSFTPTASDPDGDTPNGGGLTFSISNRPLWATFDEATGTLSGIALLGTTSNIVISVRDRQGATTSMQPFSLGVQAAPPTGTATVSWTPPTTNTDDSQLTDLAGFRVYYGTSPTSLTQASPEITNAAATQYTVNNLANGTWYFAVRAFNAARVESDLSNVVSKVIQ